MDGGVPAGAVGKGLRGPRVLLLTGLAVQRPYPQPRGPPHKGVPGLATTQYKPLNPHKYEGSVQWKGARMDTRGLLPAPNGAVPLPPSLLGFRLPSPMKSQRKTRATSTCASTKAQCVMGERVVSPGALWSRWWSRQGIVRALCVREHQVFPFMRSYLLTTKPFPASAGLAEPPPPPQQPEEGACGLSLPITLLPARSNFTTRKPFSARDASSAPCKYRGASRAENG